MITPPIDMHLHAKNMGSAKKFIMEMALTPTKLKKKISFANHEYMLDSTYLSNYCKRFGIEYIPGFGLKTKEGIDLNLYRPSEIGLELLETLSKERSFWLSLIFEQLKEDEYFIDPFELLAMAGKEKIEELELSDICIYFAEDDYTEEIETADQFFSEVLRPLLNSGLVPKYRLSFEEVLNAVKGEELSLVNPEKNPELLNHDHIINVVFNEATDEETIKECKKSSTVIPIYGSGRWV